MGFLLPNLLGFAIFTAWPVIFSLAISLSNWNLQHTVPFRWTWTRNFSDIFHDPQFWVYFGNTGYLMIGIPFAIAGSLILAIMLSPEVKGNDSLPHPLLSSIDHVRRCLNDPLEESL